jgi:hypothetical protein
MVLVVELLLLLLLLLLEAVGITQVWEISQIIIMALVQVITEFV